MASTFDTIIRGASIYDGSGRPPSVGDVGVRGDRIASLGSLPLGAGGEEIDGSGLALAPGFIDTHTHDDRALLSTDMACKASQGVTTVVAGNCGVSLAPLKLDGDPPPPLNLIGGRGDYRFDTFADYLGALSENGIAVNAACLLGHSTLRVAAMDRLDRPATKGELGEMRRRATDALAAGAIGFSTGLEYPPARAAPQEEVIALASLCAASGGIYTTHMRDEGDHVDRSLAESFTIAEGAGVPLLISHHKCCGLSNHGRSTKTLAQIASASERHPVALDLYPYAASSTILRKQWVTDAMRTLVTWSTPYPEMNGRDLRDIAKEWKLSLDEAIDRLSPAGAIYFDMDEADVRRIMSFPSAMIGSDGLPHDAHPHPRLWGTFPRVLGHYARDVGLFPLEEAIRKMTSLPAATFGLEDRGVIRSGGFADLVLFDPRTVLDRASFERPDVPADGILQVWVNGTCVWREGRRTAARPGSVLTH